MPKIGLMNPDEKKVREWVVGSKGGLTKIAEAFSVSPQYVQKIAYRRGDAKSKGLRIERALREAGCPGIRVG